MPAVLNAKIDRYAFLYSKTWAQEADASALIPYMLAQFLVNEQVFQNSEREVRLNGSPTLPQ
jgi:hypothetical protein